MSSENNGIIQKWEVLSRRTAADFRLFSIEEKKVRSPRTGAAMDVQAIHFPDMAVVLPLTDDRTVVMIHQYRHGSEQICLELPGGLVDLDDDCPETSARRELMEETGYRADRIIRMGTVYPQPAVLSNRCFLFLASNVQPMGDLALDAGEDIGRVTVPIKEIPDKIRQGEIDNAMTVLAFSYYWMMISPER